MSDALAMIAGLLFLTALAWFFYAGVRSLWRGEQEYKARRAAQRAANGLPPLTHADRAKESVFALLAAAGLFAFAVFFGQGERPWRILFLAAPAIYGWRVFAARRRQRLHGQRRYE